MADRPPILLLPEGYEFNDKQEDLLKDMGRLYKMNELVRDSCTHFFQWRRIMRSHMELSLLLEG